MSMERIYLLGSNGMLGQMVQRYFGERPDWQVISVDVRFDHAKLVDYFRRYDDEEPAVFINCIGAIPQKVSQDDGFVLPNILVPLELARGLARQHVLVHPSTDCVFKGDRAEPYPADSTPDATDAYGWSKLQAERILAGRPNTLIVRTSIVGPDERSATGLLQWFLSQPTGAKLNGFTNHLWNGLTTLQWCIEVEGILRRPPKLPKLLQVGTAESYTKYQMLCLFRDAFRPDISVHPVEHATAVNRRLEPELVAPRFPEQIDQLREILGG
jgi:dTDP-4-dehydrorhamnose reductase